MPQVTLKSHWFFGHAHLLKGTGAVPNLIDGMKDLCVDASPPDTGLATFDMLGFPAVTVLR
jgi:hypothetical protein